MAENVKGDIFLSSIQALLNLLTTHITGPNDPIDIILVQRTEHFREQFKKRGEVDFPFIAVMIDNVTVMRTGYNNYVLRELGISGNYSLDEKVIQRWKLTPIECNLGIRYITNTSNDILKFIQKWLHLRYNLTFELRQGNMSIFIQVIPSEEIQTPEFSIEEIGEKFELETRITMYTYVGSIDISG